ncbi:hypothetical protein R6Q57_013231 [Mikania cordata]
MIEVDEKRNEVIENLCSTSCIEKVFKYRSHNEDLIKEVTKQYNYQEAWRRIDELSSELEHVKTQLSKTKIQDDKYEYESTIVANMIDVQCRRKEKIGLGFT